MPKQENERHEGKRDMTIEMQKYFRQAYHLVRIFYELKKNDGESEFDPETNRVRYDLHSSAEGEPTAFSLSPDTEQDQIDREAWENRTTEIVRETETWIRLLSDGGVEVVFESKRYDQGYVTPTISLDESPMLLQAMLASARERDDEDGELDTLANDLSESPVIVLGRSRKTLILYPDGLSGTVNMSGWSQKYDYDGKLLEESTEELKTYEAKDSAVFGSLSTLRFNMMSELRYLLNKSVESEAPEYYRALFTSEVRHSILDLAISEIKNAVETDTKQNQDEIDVTGGCRFETDFVFPEVHFFHNLRNTGDNGVITLEHVSLDCDLNNVYFVEEIQQIAPLFGSQSFAEKSKYSRAVVTAVREWKKTQLEKIGLQIYESRLKNEFEKMKEQLVAGEGGVTGQIRILKINPSTGRYTYHFVLRNEQEFEIHAQNHEDPSCDELSMLLSLAI